METPPLREIRDGTPDCVSMYSM
uniref:Uncharacterized protein n=1 Tax=Anguilla anguilla TaxID=7936 RepID=A0A0E9QDS8_ANGAN